MSVRPHPHKEGFWIIDFRDSGGRRRQIQYRGAEAQAREIEHSFRIQTRGAKPLGVHPSLAEAAPDYIEHYKLDHLESGTERTRNSFKPILRLLGRYQFPSITGPVVEDYKRTRLAEGVTASTVNKELAHQAVSRQTGPSSDAERAQPKAGHPVFAVAAAQTPGPVGGHVLLRSAGFRGAGPQG